MCVGSVNRLRRLDWAGRLAYGDARDGAVLAAHPQVDPARALERLHLEVPAPDGRAPRILDGFHALRWMAGRLPALWILWPFLWLPGAAAIGTRVYDRIAGNRFVFGSCTDDCALPEDVPAGSPATPPSSSSGASPGFSTGGAESSRVR